MKFHLVKQFFQLEAISGILLLITLAVALLIANSPFNSLYQHFLEFPLDIRLGSFMLQKPLELWINEGLMAIFFMSLALEIKREILVGHLSNVRQVILPCVAALGGILMPAIIFVCFNYGDKQTLAGWAIPTATDVALALGMVVLLGKRVPRSLKIFLTVLAIVDDIVAIALIAFFYTEHLVYQSLAIALVGVIVLILLNAFNIKQISIYLLAGIMVWLAVLESGVHATLAGVVVGFCIPFKANDHSPLKQLERRLSPIVAYIVLPLFILANAGVQFDEMSSSQLVEPVTLGVMFGLFIGKQLGVFGFSWLVIKAGWAHLPERSNWTQLYGVALLAGIGFTMSLFISSLAYDTTSYELTSRAGILLGSLLSAVAGVTVLLWAKSTLGNDKT